MQTSQKTTAHLRKRSLSWSVCRASLILAFALTTRVILAAEFIPLGFSPDNAPFIARGVSDDGSIVAGNFSGGLFTEAQRWTQAAGFEDLGIISGGDRSSANAVSGDGSTIVGFSAISPTCCPKTFVFTDDNGMQLIGIVDNSDEENSGSAVSYDGNTVVGRVRDFLGAPSLRFIAYRWTESEGMVNLGFLPEDRHARATDVSSDGSVIVGRNQT